MTKLLTPDEIAAYFQVPIGQVKSWIKRGALRARADGSISKTALTIYTHRQQRITRRYLLLRAGGKSLSAKDAWEQAKREENQRRTRHAAESKQRRDAQRILKRETQARAVSTKTTKTIRTLTAQRAAWGHWLDLTSGSHHIGGRPCLL